MNKKIIGVFAIIILIVAGLIWARKNVRQMQPPGERIYAVFNGGEIRAQEILDVIQIDPGTDAETIFNVKVAATVQKVKRRLLEIEAGKQKISPENLMEKMSSDTPAVTDQDVKTYLSNLGKDPAKVSKEVFENHRKIVRNHKVMTAGNQYLDELYKRGDVHIYVEK